MQAGNAYYRKASDLPEVIPVFPLVAGLLLPRGQMPLNIFEPRYLVMVDEVLAGDRLIGIIQPKIVNGVAVEDKEGATKGTDRPELSDVGCLGRITSYTETGDGRLLITLQGVCRFKIEEEQNTAHPFRMARVTCYLQDLEEDQGEKDVDREALLQAFRNYLEANSLDADWESIAKAGNETLVNALSMMSPFGEAEKQALLEAPDLKTRAETLVAITEIALVRSRDDYGSGLQ
ncbi:LON peptidase substrate-binding domain-containing protein [Pseudochrobactrum sp. MP213Fo]|uniref:LON peptidase substrate-binding domain-containing protein n=1 Tax=Pseudochrobactrum sp. MP213Fo TaxID=3022250 RepID=UPI003BA15107